MANSCLKKYPPTDLKDDDTKYQNQTTAIAIVGDYKVKDLVPVIKSFFDHGHKVGQNLRANVLRALMKIDPANASIGAEILKNDSVMDFKIRIATAMGEFPGKELNKALDQLKSIPFGLQEPVALALATSFEGNNILLNKVERGEILPRVLLQPRVHEAFHDHANMPQGERENTLVAGIPPISAEKQAAIDKRLASFEALDKKKLSLDSGAMVFQQNCGVCHKLGGQLGVGPQLDGIGKTGAHGLIEKILDPNRNISRAFQNYTIKLKDGTTKSGLFRRDEGQSKVFADITGKEFTIANSDIAEQKLSKFTLMPDSFESTITEKDFNLLVNYLLSL